MEKRTKILLAVASMVVLATIYVVNSEEKLDNRVSSVTNGSKSENNKLNNNERKVSEKIINRVDAEQKSDVLNYKDVFKEPQALQTTVEKISEREEIKDLDAETNNLISEADALIAKKNLTLEAEPISEEDKKEHETRVNELEEKLSNINKY